MLAAADERGCTQLFDVGARAVMRTFGGHTKAVHVVRFGADGGRLFTASDDTTAVCWDVTAESQLCTLEGHTDFVRSGALSPASPHLFATGSYDHSVKVWDVRAHRCVTTLRHVAPVEDVLILPGGGMLAAPTAAPPATAATPATVCPPPLSISRGSPAVSRVCVCTNVRGTRCGTC
jgi:U3 small nucleolar RNA-associated protein 15